MKYPRIGMYSAIAGNGYPLLLPDGTINKEAIRKQAKYETVILDVSAPIHRPDILWSLRTVNPKIRIFGYVMGSVYWNNPNPSLGSKEQDFAWKYYSIVDQTDGYLYCINGISKGNVNVAKQETMLNLADLITTQVTTTELWDGLFLDVTCPQIHGIVSGDCTYDINRMGYTRVEDYEAAWRFNHRNFIERISMNSPPDFPIVGNCGPGGETDLFNGWMRENFPHQNLKVGDDSWIGNMIMNGWGNNGYLAEQYRNKESWLVMMPSYGDETNPENHHRVRYGLASATLGEGFFSFARLENDLRRFWWFPEYDIDLGQPIEEAHRDIKVPALWVREFTNGLVIVNPTNDFHSIYLHRMYHPPLSAWKTAFSIPPNDGLFLLKT